MARLRRIGQVVVVFIVLLGSLVQSGCGNNDFLGLEDYQRDILVGGLAIALLAQQAQQSAGGEGAGATAGRDGADGEDGLNCWDRNGNGEADPAEDVNADGVFDALDCQGPEGPSGPTGTDGTPGETGTPGVEGLDGTDGLHCWDLDGDGEGNPSEDVNGDGLFDVQDCQGIAGPAGPVGDRGSRGVPGADGADGPEFFDVFIDDFFTIDGAPRGGLPVVAVSIIGPVLGRRDVYTGVDGLVGYRVAIPDTYQTGNDVTMRLFFHRSGTYEGSCFVFSVDARRLRPGSGIEPYGVTQWVHVDSDTGEEEILLVVDVPVNTPGSLGYTAGPLAGGDFLAFELRTALGDERSYLLLGVELFESGFGTATFEGVADVYLEAPTDCGFTECASNADCPDDMHCVEGICVEPG